MMKHTKTLVFMTLALFFLIGCSLINRFPEDLVSTLENVDYVADLEEHQVVVYYPLVDNEVVQENLKALANEILEDMIAFDIYDTKIEFETYDVESYYSYRYLINHQEDEIIYDYFSDDEGNRIDESHCSDFLRKQISLDARAYAKLDENIKELAYTSTFTQETTVDQLKPFSLMVMDEVLVVYFEDYYQGYPLRFTMPLDEVILGLDIELDIASKVSNADLRLPKRVIDKDRPMVALTFDDGPYAPSTNLITEALYQNDGVATFYVVGNRMPTEIGTMLNTISLGNEIGSHTWSHPDLRKCDEEKLEVEFHQTSEMVKELSEGLYEIKTFRPPYSFTNKEVRKASPYPFILWNVDSEDWRLKEVDLIVENTLKEVQDGSIIIMHDMYENSAMAAVQIIEQLKQDGYQLVSVLELFEAKGVSLETGKTYRYASE